MNEQGKEGGILLMTHGACIYTHSASKCFFFSTYLFSSLMSGIVQFLAA
jgi:hypothetical protein